ATRTEALLEHCLRERRLVAAVAAALAAPGARPPAAPPRAPWKWCAAALLLMASGALLGYQWVRAEARPSAVVSGRVLVDGVEAGPGGGGSGVGGAGEGGGVRELSDGSHAERAPASAAVLRGRGEGARKVVELDRGGGTFRVPKGGRPFWVDTRLGKVRAQGAEFSAELQPVAEEEEESMSDRGALLLVVAALVGQVEVQSKGHTYVLGPGKSLAFAGDGKPRYVKPSFSGTVVAVAADGKSLTVEGPVSKKGGVTPRKVFTLS